MARITLKGNPIHTNGDLPLVGTRAPDFTVQTTDGPLTRDDLAGRRVVLNIFPNIQTSVCQTSVRTFNQRASELDGAMVLCVSNDELQVAADFCAAEGLDQVVSASALGSNFGDDYGLTITDGPLAGRLARSVLVLENDGTVIHSELVPETADEPDYQAALDSATQPGH